MGVQLLERQKMATQNGRIAHLGVCAAAAVLVASLGILFLQSPGSQLNTAPSLQPAVVPAHPIRGASTSTEQHATVSDVNS
jgi:hypothetical protein